VPNQKAVVIAKARRIEVYEDFRKGMSYIDISQKHNISLSSVSRIVNATIKELSQASSTELTLLRIEAKEKLSYIVEEALAAWEASKEFTTKKLKTKKVGGEDVGTIAEVEVGHGDIRFLEIAKEGMDSMNELYGLYPKETSMPGNMAQQIITGKNGEVIIKTAWGGALTKPDESGKLEPPAETAVDAEFEEIVEEDVDLQ